jgi:nucleoside-diphosphate-sugar epimerase
MVPSSAPQPYERRFLITGAKGFVGAWVAKNLIERGDRPVIFDLDTDTRRLQALLSREQLEHLNIVRGDVTSYDDLERSVADHGITHIIHLAALQVPACAANPLLGARINVLGTLNVFEVARRRHEQIKRVVYASSAAVFRGAVREGAELHPGTHYGVFKQCNEGNARVYSASDGISTVGLRPWAVYGVGRDQGITSGPTKAIKAAVVGRPYTIRFAGHIDLQYVDDCARIFVRCAEQDLPAARVYTLRGAVLQIDDFIATLEQVYPRARGLIHAQGQQLPIAADLDDSTLVRDLGSVPRTPLDQGIRQTIEIFERLQRDGQLDTKDLDT